jgi:hypothetical protein
MPEEDRNAFVSRAVRFEAFHNKLSLLSALLLSAGILSIVISIAAHEVVLAYDAPPSITSGDCRSAADGPCVLPYHIQEGVRGLLGKADNWVLPPLNRTHVIPSSSGWPWTNEYNDTAATITKDRVLFDLWLLRAYGLLDSPFPSPLPELLHG